MAGVEYMHGVLLTYVPNRNAVMRITPPHPQLTELLFSVYIPINEIAATDLLDLFIVFPIHQVVCRFCSVFTTLTC